MKRDLKSHYISSSAHIQFIVKVHHENEQRIMNNTLSLVLIFFVFCSNMKY